MRRKERDYEDEEELYSEDMRAFVNNADIVKSFEKVYPPLKIKNMIQQLNENFVLMGDNEKAKEFIRERHAIAMDLIDYFHGSKEGIYLFEVIMTECNDLAILYRNKKGNVMLEGLLQQGNEKPLKINEPEKGTVGKIAEKVKSVFKPKKEESE